MAKSPQAKITVAAASAAAKKPKAPKAKKPASKPTHPPTATLVNDAIKALKERGGSSLQAIKKYITANNKVDAEKLAPFIKKYLKSAVEKGTLVQTKGKGASGSFKLSAATLKPRVEKEKKPAKKQAVDKAKKPTTATKVRTSAKQTSTSNSGYIWLPANSPAAKIAAAKCVPKSSHLWLPSKSGSAKSNYIWLPSQSAPKKSKAQKQGVTKKQAASKKPKASKATKA